MELTGKAKQLFEEWYNDKLLCNHFNEIDDLYYHLLECFYSLPPEMQKGVYEAFADSLGYDLDVFRCNDEKVTAMVVYWGDGDMNIRYNEDFINKSEAFEAELKELNNIINK